MLTPTQTPRGGLFVRFLSAFLIGALCLPPPVHALRPLNAGSEESPVKNELARNLGNAGTEETAEPEDPIEALFRKALELEAKPRVRPASVYMDRLIDAMDGYLQAKTEGAVALAFENAVESLGYGGVALYFVEPSQKPGGRFLIRNEFRNGGFAVRQSAAAQPVEAAFEKDWALNSPTGDLHIDDRWKAAGSRSKGRIDLNVLNQDALDYGGQEKVKEVYYLVLKNGPAPWGLVLLQNWHNGQPLFAGSNRREKRESRRQVRELLDTLGNGALLALENVRSLERSRQLAKMAKAVHDLKNDINVVIISADLLQTRLKKSNLDPRVWGELSRLGAEVSNLSQALNEKSHAILQEFRPLPAVRPVLNTPVLAEFNWRIHQLAVDLWDPVVRGDVERLRELIIDVRNEAQKQYPGQPDSAQRINALLDRWEEMGSLAIAARTERLEEKESFVSQLRRMNEEMESLGRLKAALELELAARGEAGEPWDTVRKIVGMITRLEGDSEKKSGLSGFLAQIGETIEATPQELAAGGPRDLVKELRDAVETSAAARNVVFGGVRNGAGRLIEGLPVDAETGALVSGAMVELLQNSWKYKRNEKSLRVEITAVYDAGRLRVTVADNGLGIPKKQQSQLFQMGNRIERQEIAGIQGTGFGLAPLREALRAEKFKGDLMLVSSNALEDVRQGRLTGSAFRFELDVRPVTADAAGTEEAAQDRQSDPLAAELHRLANLFSNPVLVAFLVNAKAQKTGKPQIPELAELGDLGQEMAGAARELMQAIEQGVPAEPSKLKGQLDRLKEVWAKIDMAQLLAIDSSPAVQNLPDYIDDILYNMELMLGRIEGSVKDSPSVPPPAAAPIETRIEQIVAINAAALGEQGSIEYGGIEGVPAGAALALTPEQAKTVTDTLLELLKNAGKYRLPGVPLEVTVGGVYRDGFLELRVEDNGIGLTPEDQKKYGRGGLLTLPGGVTVTERAGLGIAGQKAALQSLGGDLQLDPDRSGLGVGLSVLIRLPVSHAMTVSTAGAEEQEARLLEVLREEIMNTPFGERVGKALDRVTLAALRSIQFSSVRSVQRVLEKVSSLRPFQKGELAAVADALERFQTARDPMNKRFTWEAWAKLMYSEPGAAPGETVIPADVFLRSIDIHIRSVRPDFKLTNPPEPGTAVTPAQLADYSRDVIEQILFPNRIYAYESSLTGQLVIVRLKSVFSRMTPAGRNIPVYVYEPPPGDLLGGGAAADYVVLNGRPQSSKFYADTRRAWTAGGHRNWASDGRPLVEFNFPDPAEDPENLTRVRNFLGWALSLQTIGRLSASEYEEFEREDTLIEELTHADTRAFGNALMGNKSWRTKQSGGAVAVIRKILREEGSLRRSLDAFQLPEEQDQEAQAVIEVEAWLATLRDSSQPAYRLLWVVAPQAMPKYARARQLMTGLLQEALFPGVTDKAEWWNLLMRKSALELEDLNQKLREAAKRILDEEFIPVEARTAPRPWRPQDAAGAEERTDVLLNGTHVGDSLRQEIQQKILANRRLRVPAPLHKVVINVLTELIEDIHKYGYPVLGERGEYVPYGDSRYRTILSVSRTADAVRIDIIDETARYQREVENKQGFAPYFYKERILKVPDYLEQMRRSEKGERGGWGYPKLFGYFRKYPIEMEERIEPKEGLPVGVVHSIIFLTPPTQQLRARLKVYQALDDHPGGPLSGKEWAKLAKVTPATLRKFDLEKIVEQENRIREAMGGLMPPVQLSNAGAEEAVRALQVPRQGLELDGLTVRATGQLAAGLEAVLEPGRGAIVVPVAYQPAVPLLAHTPGIRELQASLREAGIEVAQVQTPQESAELLRAKDVSLLIVAPEDVETGDWRGGTAAPTVVMPAAVAASLNAQELASVAAAAAARGGILYIRDITRAQMEEAGSVLVLQMA